MDGAPFPLAMRLHFKPHEFHTDSSGFMLISGHMDELLQYEEPRFEASPCRPVLSQPSSILSVTGAQARAQANTAADADYRSLFYVATLCAEARADPATCVPCTRGVTCHRPTKWCAIDCARPSDVHARPPCRCSSRQIADDDDESADDPSSTILSEYDLQASQAWVAPGGNGSQCSAPCARSSVPSRSIVVRQRWLYYYFPFDYQHLEFKLRVPSSDLEASCSALAASLIRESEWAELPDWELRHGMSSVTATPEQTDTCRIKIDVARRTTVSAQPRRSGWTARIPAAH